MKVENLSSPSAVEPELEKKEPTLNEPLSPISPEAPKEPSLPVMDKETSTQPSKEPVKLTLVKNELIGVLEYAETLCMIQIRGSEHPGISWAGGKLMDHLTEAKHWVYEIQLLPPMPKQSPIVTPRDFLKKK